MKELIEAYAAQIEAEYEKDAFWGHGGKHHFFTVTYGPKFAKIIVRSHGQGSVHCFVHLESGDIHKADSWTRPAKGPRGNIKNERRPIFGKDFYYGKR